VAQTVEHLLVIAVSSNSNPTKRERKEERKEKEGREGGKTKLIPALRRLRKEDLEFKASLNYIEACTEPICGLG
jgi:hypothetical protein